MKNRSLILTALLAVFPFSGAQAQTACPAIELIVGGGVATGPVSGLTIGRCTDVSWSCDEDSGLWVFSGRVEPYIDPVTGTYYVGYGFGGNSQGSENWQTGGTFDFQPISFCNSEGSLRVERATVTIVENDDGTQGNIVSDPVFDFVTGDF